METGFEWARFPLFISWLLQLIQLESFRIHRHICITWLMITWSLTQEYVGETWLSLAALAAIRLRRKTTSLLAGKLASRKEGLSDEACESMGNGAERNSWPQSYSCFLTWVNTKDDWVWNLSETFTDIELPTLQSTRQAFASTWGRRLCVDNGTFSFHRFPSRVMIRSSSLTSISTRRSNECLCTRFFSWDRQWCRGISPEIQFREPAKIHITNVYGVQDQIGRL